MPDDILTVVLFKSISLPNSGCSSKWRASEENGMPGRWLGGPYLRFLQA